MKLFRFSFSFELRPWKICPIKSSLFRTYFIMTWSVSSPWKNTHMFFFLLYFTLLDRWKHLVCATQSRNFLICVDWALFRCSVIHTTKLCLMLKNKHFNKHCGSSKFKSVLLHVACKYGLTHFFFNSLKTNMKRFQTQKMGES